jgi:hypothetical protein
LDHGFELSLGGTDCLGRMGADGRVHRIP